MLPWALPRARTVAHLCVLFACCQEKPLCLLLLPVSSAPARGPRPSWGAPPPTPTLPGVSTSSTATLPLSFPPLLSLLSLPSSCVEVTSAHSVPSLRFRSSSLSRPRQVTGPPGTSCPLDPEAAACVSSHSCWSGPPDIRPQSMSRKVLARVLLWVHSLCTCACQGQRQGSSQGTSSALQLGPAPQTH